MIPPNPTPYDLLVHFVLERERVRRKKEAGDPLPWTDDPILAKFRFCNVHRENDRVTRWIHTNWLEPNTFDPDVWFAMAVARHVNLPQTLAAIGYPVPWNPERFIGAIQGLRDLKLPAYNAAYMIRAARGKDWGDKAEYLAKCVLGPMWEKRGEICPKEGDTLAAFNQRLLAQYGVAGFMSGQIIADTKHAFVLSAAEDWWTFAVSGPGSRRGLNRLLGRDKGARWKEEAWHAELLALLSHLMTDVEVEVQEIDAQNCQNCLCEVDKYMRSFYEEGRPKQRYVPLAKDLFGVI